MYVKRIRTNGHIPLKWWGLVFCIGISGLICISKINGSSVLLYGCMALFFALCFVFSEYEMELQFLLFFLPWSPLIKLYPGAISFYTIALILFCLIGFAKCRFRLQKYQILLTTGLVLTSLIAKALQGNGFTNSYFIFFLMLLLFPCVLIDKAEKVSYYNLTVYFSLGIITAALTAQQVATMGNISKYITIQSYLRITRLSGFYGDPNFYSAHVSAAISGVLLLLFQEKQRNQRLILAILGVVLTYCGLLSASKMFITVFALLFLVWVPLILRRGGRFSSKVALILGVVCTTLILLSSVAFQELLRILGDRIAYASNLSQLTTGRTDIWKDYIRAILFDPLLLLVGEGYSPVVLEIKASHNSLIQAFFQFGVVGTGLLGGWAYDAQQRIFSGTIRQKHKTGFILLMMTGCILPWMSLDILFFDDFFLLPAFATIGITEK